MRTERTGFTLIETMIVMIIIGILAGMLLLASFSATARAEATKLVSNMENLRVGCVMYYCDKEVWPEDLSQLAGTMDIQYSPEKWASMGYALTDSDSDLCCVICDVTRISEGIRNSLNRMAQQSGILYSKTNGAINSNQDIDLYAAQDTGYILMVVYNKSRHQ